MQQLIDRNKNKTPKHKPHKPQIEKAVKSLTSKIRKVGDFIILDTNGNFKPNFQEIDTFFDGSYVGYEASTNEIYLPAFLDFTADFSDIICFTEIFEKQLNSLYPNVVFETMLSLDMEFQTSTVFFYQPRQNDKISPHWYSDNLENYNQPVRINTDISEF
jgi:hypothetical protein